MRSPLTTAQIVYPRTIESVISRWSALGSRRTAVAALMIAVAADRLSVPLGSTNFRVELVIGFLIASWLLLRSKGAVREFLRVNLGSVEIGLFGWWAANVLSSLFFSPFPTLTVKYTFIIAGVLVIYAVTNMLLSSMEMLRWAAVIWVGVGTVVGVLGLMAALLYATFGLTSGILLERVLQNDIFTVTPQVQSIIWEPNILGSYSLTVLSLAYSLSLAPEFRSSAWQNFFRLAVAVATCATLLSMTRTAWVLCAVLVASLLILPLKLRLAGLKSVLTKLAGPVGVGAAVGLFVGLQLMPTLSWRSKSPWDLSYAQVEQVVHNVIMGGSPPSDEDIKHQAPNSSAVPPTTGTPVAVSRSSALEDKAREASAPADVPSLALRWSVFNLALQDALRRPFLGWGTGSFRYVHPPPMGGGFWIANLELHVMFDAGLLGLLPLLYAFMRAGWRAIRVLRAPEQAWNTIHFVLLGLLVGGVALLGAYQVTEGTWLGFTWVLFGMLAAASRLAAVAPPTVPGASGAVDAGDKEREFSAAITGR